MTDSTHHILRERLLRIEAEISALSKERDEIRSALDVVARYTTSATSSTAMESQVKEADAQPALGAGRPEGIPTIWDMVLEFFNNSKVQSATVGDITDFIRGRWWPGVANSQVGPTLYRIAGEGRLRKVGKGKFALPDIKNEPPYGGSEPGEVATSPKMSAQGTSGDLPSYTS